MPTHIYRKLVRDRIPEIVRADGGTPTVKTLDDAAFESALRVKLVEEAQEAVAAPDEPEIKKELADIYEVVQALCRLHGFSEQTILDEQKRRRDERGGFEQRTWLESIEE